MILGVSPQGEASHAKFRAKYDLPFPLLIDEDHAIAEAYGAWGEKKLYGRTYMGIIRGMERIEEAFYRAVVRGQEAGEISTSRDARALARYLVNSENGLMVMAKANREREVMADIVKTVLSVLE